MFLVSSGEFFFSHSGNAGSAAFHRDTSGGEYLFDESMVLCGEESTGLNKCAKFEKTVLHRVRVRNLQRTRSVWCFAAGDPFQMSIQKEKYMISVPGIK